MNEEYRHYLALAIEHHEKKLEVLKAAAKELDDLDKEFLGVKLDPPVGRPASRYEALFQELAHTGRPVRYPEMMATAKRLGLEMSKQDMRNKVAHQRKFNLVRRTDEGYVWLPRTNVPIVTHSVRKAV